MLLIILLGVLAKLAVVCADSNIDTVTIKTSERTNLSGTWYWLYHFPQNFNDDLECIVSTYEPISKSFGKVTTSFIVKSTQTRHQNSGNVIWNSNGYLDVRYPERNSGTKSVLNESCIKKPSYTSLWNDRYHVLSGDPRRYLIFDYPCQQPKKMCFYVWFRTPHPEEEALDDVKKDLKRKGFNFNRLVKWENKHC